MKLLHVFSTFCSAGPQIRFLSIARSLAGEFTHAVISMDGRYDAAQRVGRDVSIRLLAAPKKTIAPLQYWRIRQAIRQESPDLLLTYNWGAIDAIIGTLVSRLCPVIHTEDGFNPDEAVTLKKRRILARRFLLKQIYTTVVPSFTLLEIAEFVYGLPSSKIDFIPNGINTALWDSSTCGDTRRNLKIANDTFVIGYVGQLRPEKHLEMLIRAYAAAQLRNSTLVLVGDGPSRSMLEQISAENGVSASVIFTGSKTDPRPYMNSFDLFAMSSYTEQMPMSLLEAMACGLPAVCTDVGDCGRMLEASGHPVLVQRGDVAAYAAALSALAADRSLRRRLGEDNRRRCIDQYSERAMIERYSALYKTAIESYANTRTV